MYKIRITVAQVNLKRFFFKLIRFHNRIVPQTTVTQVNPKCCSKTNTVPQSNCFTTKVTHQVDLNSSFKTETVPQ